MSGPSPAIEELVAVVSDLTGETVTFVDELTFSNRAVVARLALRGETVIAKRPHDASAFANEVAAMRILPTRTRPELIAAGCGTVVMEDLGGGPSLADLLLGDDRSAAENGLLAWAKTVGTALAATVRGGAPAERISLEHGFGELLEFATELGVTAPPALEVEVGLIEDVLSATTPWWAYCPGDTCPDNNRVLTDGSLRLFDFEGAGWRHAAHEAAYCRAPFCTCWCVATLPPGMTDAMEAEFLHALDPPQRESFRSVKGSPVGPVGRTPIDGRQYVILRLRRTDLSAVPIATTAMRLQPRHAGEVLERATSSTPSAPRLGVGWLRGGVRRPPFLRAGGLGLLRHPQESDEGQQQGYAKDRQDRQDRVASLGTVVLVHARRYDASPPESCRTRHLSAKTPQGPMSSGPFLPGTAAPSSRA